MTQHRALAAALLSLCIAGTASPGFAQGCVSGKEGRQLIQQGQVAPLPDAMRRAGIRGEVIDAKLCGGGGGYVYRVRVREKSGEISSMNIPAS